MLNVVLSSRLLQRLPSVIQDGGGMIVRRVGTNLIVDEIGSTCWIRAGGIIVNTLCACASKNVLLDKITY